MPINFKSKKAFPDQVVIFKRLLDECECAERDKQTGSILDDRIREEEKELKKKMGEFVGTYAEEILESAAGSSVSESEIGEIRERIQNMSALLGTELLFAIMENEGEENFRALTDKEFHASLEFHGEEIAAARLYEIRITQNVSALTDERLSTDTAISFFNALGKEAASEWFNSIGWTGNVETLTSEKALSDKVISAIKENSKVASELSYVLGTTGDEKSVLGEEFLEYSHRLSADQFSSILSAMWITRRPEEFSHAGAFDMINDEGSLVLGEGSKTVLLTKLGDQEHDRGAKLAMQSLIDAGYRVAYIGGARGSEEVAEAASRLGAQAVGFSLSEDSQQQMVTDTLNYMRDRGDENVHFFGGGLVTTYAASKLEQAGVRFFTPESGFRGTIDFLNSIEVPHPNITVPSAHIGTGINLHIDLTSAAIGSIHLSHTSTQNNFTLQSTQQGIVRESERETQMATEEARGITIPPYGKLELTNRSIALNPTGVTIPISKAVIVTQIQEKKSDERFKVNDKRFTFETAKVQPVPQNPDLIVSERIVAHSSRQREVMLMMASIMPEDGRERLNRADATQALEKQPARAMESELTPYFAALQRKSHQNVANPAFAFNIDMLDARVVQPVVDAFKKFETERKERKIERIFGQSHEFGCKLEEEAKRLQIDTHRLNQGNYYTALDIGQTSDAAKIRKAYLEQVKKHHPDVSMEDDAESRMEAVNQAYSVLKDKKLKDDYDKKTAKGKSTLTEESVRNVTNELMKNYMQIREKDFAVLERETSMPMEREEFIAVVDKFGNWKKRFERAEENTLEQLREYGSKIRKLHMESDRMLKHERSEQAMAKLKEARSKLEQLALEYKKIDDGLKIAVANLKKEVGAQERALMSRMRAF